MNDYTDITGPVYGAESKGKLYATYGILAAVAVWTLYCVIIAVVYGIKGTWEHFCFALLMICTFVHLLLSFGLYKKSDQEEGKFLVNLVVCVIIVFLVGLVLNFYVWSLSSSGSCDEPPATNCTTTTPVQCDANAGQYLNTMTNQCVSCNQTSGNKTLTNGLYGSRLL